MLETCRALLYATRAGEMGPSTGTFAHLRVRLAEQAPVSCADRMTRGRMLYIDDRLYKEFKKHDGGRFSLGFAFWSDHRSLKKRKQSTHLTYKPKRRCGQSPSKVCH